MHGGWDTTSVGMPGWENKKALHGLTSMLFYRNTPEQHENHSAGEATTKGVSDRDFQEHKRNPAVLPYDERKYSPPSANSKSRMNVFPSLLVETLRACSSTPLPDYPCAAYTVGVPKRVPTQSRLGLFAAAGACKAPLAQMPVRMPK